MLKSASSYSHSAWELRWRYRRIGRAAPLSTEPRYTTGEVKITLARLILLQALLDHPKATAPSLKAWYRSARALSVGYTGRGTLSTVFVVSQKIEPCWVVRKRVGRCITVRLTNRGLAILRREVPARVVGHGPYVSLREFRPSARG
jgi:hypothetical protein